MSGIEKEAREEGGVVDEALEELTSKIEKKVILEDQVEVADGLTSTTEDPEATGPHEKTETDKVPEEET